MADDPEPEFADMLAHLLKQLVGTSRNPSDPKSDNPNDYERSVEITDDESILLFDKVQYIRKTGERKLSELNALKHEHDAVRERFFLRLEDAYPIISGSAARAGVGWRSWRGKLYYVAWDRKEQSNSDSQPV